MILMSIICWYLDEKMLEMVFKWIWDIEIYFLIFTFRFVDCNNLGTRHTDNFVRKICAQICRRYRNLKLIRITSIFCNLSANIPVGHDKIFVIIFNLRFIIFHIPVKKKFWNSNLQTKLSAKLLVWRVAYEVKFENLNHCETEWPDRAKRPYFWGFLKSESTFWK